MADETTTSLTEHFVRARLTETLVATPARCVCNAQPRGRPRNSRRWQQLYLVQLRGRWHKLLLIDRDSLVNIYVVKLRLAFHISSFPRFPVSRVPPPPCKAVPRFPVLRFPPLQHGAAVFHRVFRSRILFSAPWYDFFRVMTAWPVPIRLAYINNSKYFLRQALISLAKQTRTSIFTCIRPSFFSRWTGLDYKNKYEM